MRILLFFAQNSLPLDTVSLKRAGSSTLQILLLFGALGLVTLVLLIWAAFFRNPTHRSSRHHHHHHHHHHQSSEPAETRSSSETSSSGDEEGTEPSSPSRRRRRRRREHRPRNPTLAETGGLPPPRSDNPSGPIP